MISNEMVDVCMQPIQEKFVKISLLQNFFVNEGAYKVRKFKKVGEIQGNALGGSINIDVNSAIRRTCSIDMVVTDSSFLISKNSKIWMDKWLRVELGIRSLKTGNIVWFDKGVYAINNPTVRYSNVERVLHIEGLDPMCTLDGTLGGALGKVTQLPVGTSISDSVKTTVWQLGGISQSQIYVEQNDIKLPYSIEKNSTDTVYSILDELGKLFMDWEFYFDVNGRFTYQKIKNRYVKNPIPNYDNDIIEFNFLEQHELIINYDYTHLFTNVKNKIIVWGRLLDDGVQIKYELPNTDINSPFNINSNIGEIPLVITDNNIFDSNQAEQRCRYEFYKHNNMNEKVNIQLLPLYFLNENRLVEFNKPEINLFGKFLIDSMVIPLDIGAEMSISAHKVYEVE